MDHKLHLLAYMKQNNIKTVVVLDYDEIFCQFHKLQILMDLCETNNVTTLLYKY